MKQRLCRPGRVHVRAAAAAAVLLALASCPALAADWTASWGAALMPPNARTALEPAALHGATLRQQMRLSLGGPRLRVRISNRYGETPLVVGAAGIAPALRPGAPDLAAAPVALRFDGAAGITLAPGAEALSDPLDMATQDGELVAVSLYVESAPATGSVHIAAHATAFLAPGNGVMARAIDGARALTSWYQVEGIEVDPGRVRSPSVQPGVLVAIGDSLTDGTGAGLDRDERWPDWLGRRLHDGHAAPLAIVNAGIGGNRMLADDNGPRLLARFAHDALDRPGVTHVLALIGVNDLGRQHRDGLDTPAARAAMLAELEQGWLYLARAAHARGVCLIAGTLTPYGGTPLYAPAADNDLDRLRLNAWLRAHAADDGPLDGVADFDAAVRDPAAPERLQAGFDAGDHLHLSPAGYRALAQAVPLDRLGACRWRHER
jgi:lysophospholipase L1-like esterase